MQIVYYTDDAHLRCILATRTDAAAAAVVIVPRGWAWLVKDKATPGPVQPCTAVVFETDMGVGRQRN